MLTSEQSFTVLFVVARSEFGKWLHAKAVNRAEVARRLGVSRSTLHGWEWGVSEIPASMVEAAIRELDVPNPRFEERRDVDAAC